LKTAEKKVISTLEDYAAGLDAESRLVFEQFRALVKKTVPGSTEKISYAMPAFEYKGILVWFAVWKEHYGLYPHGAALITFEKSLRDYKTSKGCVQFPKHKSLPVKLIKLILEHRVNENLRKEDEKKTKKKIAAKVKKNK